MMVPVPLYPAVLAGRGTACGPVIGTREIRDGEREIGFQEGHRGGRVVSLGKRACGRLRHLNDR